MTVASKARITEQADHTQLDVVDGGHVKTLALDERPDDEAAARFGRAFRRISWVRIDLRNGEPECTVAAVGHRLPVERPIPLSTALGLVRHRVPLLVRTGSGD